MPEHYSVLLQESLEFLAIKPDGAYLDCTAGMGGHSRAIAERLSPQGRLVVNDRDSESLEMAKRALIDFVDRVEFQCAPFSMLNETGLDGILADLGTSRFQLTDADRGFSFLQDGPLDMRMDQSRGMTAADLVNHSAEKAIADWIYQFGQERRNAQKIARAIYAARPLRSTLHLAGVVEGVVPRVGPIHPATQTFQALRIVVNSEMQELDALLNRVARMARTGGRIAIISFHSLEDVRVKQKFRELARTGIARLLTKKPVVPGKQEVRDNPASRSAKLRAIEITGSEEAK
jgi:16S rRNA (cytosine1402-N4)-methyltransferase